MVGAGTSPLASSLGDYHDMNDTMCSILDAPVMCSMASIEYLVWVDSLDE